MDHNDRPNDAEDRESMLLRLAEEQYLAELGRFQRVDQKAVWMLKGLSPLVLALPAALVLLPDFLNRQELPGAPMFVVGTLTTAIYPCVVVAWWLCLRCLRVTGVTRVLVDRKMLDEFNSPSRTFPFLRLSYTARLISKIQENVQATNAKVDNLVWMYRALQTGVAFLTIAAVTFIFTRVLS